MKTILIGSMILSLFSTVWAKDIPYTLEDRDRLIRIGTSLREFKDAVDKRFEQVDKRLEQVDKRLEEVSKRIDAMLSFIWILASVFGALVAVTIGFAVWDRRTALLPAIKRSDELEARQVKLENVLKELAQKEPIVAEILRRVGLL